MERLQHFIGKLKEQSEQKASVSQMLVTLKQIEAELVSISSRSHAIHQSTKVAVVMPSSLKFSHYEQDLAAAEQEVISMKTVEQNGFLTPGRQEDTKDWILDPLNEIPTLSHQENVRDLNDVIGSNGSSLNDKLKGNVMELAASLKESPIRELKKAIGVNDRHIFINELFRGDEPMYERSIKTINNFRILPEAEYWMERELKIKLGWDDSREITKHFYQLVRRRFS